MAARSGSCLSKLLGHKLVKTSLVCENNNYIFVRSSWTKRLDLGLGTSHVFVAIVSILCYLNSLKGDFVHDDLVAIVRNKDVTDGSLFGALWQHDFWGREISDVKSHKSYRPIVTVSFRLNYLVSGLDPISYHAVNVLLHAAVSVLLGVTCERCVWRGQLLRLGAATSVKLSTLAALLFAAHPVHTEAVSGVVGRADVLACLFFLGSFLLYNRCMRRGGGAGALVGSGVLAAAAMLCKETGVTVLGVCVLFDFFTLLTRKRSKSKRQTAVSATVKRTALTAATGAVCVYFRLRLMGNQLPVFAAEDNPAAHANSVLTRFLTHLYVHSCNAWLLLCPAVLSYDWQMGSVPLVRSVADARNISSLVFVATLAALCFATLFKLKGGTRRRFALGLLLLVVPFVPASNLLFPVGFVIAERVLYTPSVGLIILLVESTHVLHKRLKGRGSWVLCGLLIVSAAWTSRTVMRNEAWRDRQSLFLSGLKTLPHNAKMHFNYANLMKDAGDVSTASRHYQQAIRLWPQYASAYNNLGTVTQDAREAEALFRSAVRAAGPRGHAGAHFNLANLLRSQNNTEGSMSEFRKCLALDAEFSDAHSTLALLLTERGERAQAEVHHRRAVQLSPSNPHFHNNLAVFLANSGDIKGALLSYQAAYEVDSSHYTSMLNAAKLLQTQGKTNTSRELLRRVLSVTDEAEALDTAASLLYNMGDLEDAYQLYRQLLSRAPDNTKKYALKYAEILVKMDKLHDASGVVSWVLEQKPFDVKAAQHLANIYGLSQQHKQASQVLESALRHETSDHKRATLYLEIANHLKDSGQLDMAFKNYREAVVLDPTCGEAHFNLAVFYHLSGQLFDAEVHYAEARKLLPNNQLLQDNIRKLNRTRKQCENMSNCFVVPRLGLS